jgi:hypothetical protein
VAFVFSQLDPSLLFANTTTAGGDTGAHVALPAYMRAHLLTHGRLTGWDPGWYDGFPAFTFYFPLPSLLTVIVSTVVPYNIAFKLVTVLGSLALPVAAWAFGRMWKLPAAGPAVLALAMVPYLFDRTYTIYGGNLPSTLAGEYAFSIGLALGLLFLGVVSRGMRTGRQAALAAVLLALTGLSHILPTLFVIAGAGVIGVMNIGRLGWKRLIWLAKVGAVGGLLAGFWWIPFALRLAYTTDMGFVKVNTYFNTLFPAQDRWVAIAAGLGVLITVVFEGYRVVGRRVGWPEASNLPDRRLGVFLTVMAGVSAFSFVFAPQGKIWNARLLPFWVLCLYLLAGLAAYEVATLLVSSAGWLAKRKADGGVIVPIALGAATLTFVALPLQILPSWSPVHTKDASFIPDWIRWNYSGYQRKASYPEYASLVNTMANIGAQDGCGRAFWEYEPEQNRFGTPEALMLLPYWTNNCIDSQEGLLFESSSTTPYHFLNQSELSANPSDAMLGLPYAGQNFALGIEHLQMLGVRYYMAFTPAIEAQAAADPQLQMLASSGPWPVAYATGTRQVTWRIYKIANSAMVAPLAYEPAVVQPTQKTAKQWLNLSVSWYQQPARWAVPLAESGPASWPRVSLADATSPPRVPVVPATPSAIKVGDQGISFNVDRVGSPVVVRTSYFPNWHASGANGPWRISPNLMVVVPTSRHVSLSYGYTPVDWLGYLATVLGVVAAIWLRNRPPFTPTDEPPSPEWSPDEITLWDEQLHEGDQRELVGASASPGGDPPL